jgi:large subunit ribosomal protein L25
MAEITLTAETGRVTGTRPSRRLRAEGKVPAVVYGHGSEPQSVSVVWRELRVALTGDAGLNALITLVIDGKRQLSIVKSLQRDPVHHQVTHIDFILVNLDEELLVDVPIVMEGEALMVTREDGMTDQVLFMLPVFAKPDAIPNELVVDISELRLGDSIRIADITLPKGARTEADLEEAVVITELTRAAVDETEEAEAAEAAEAAAAAEGDAGEAAPAGD